MAFSAAKAKGTSAEREALLSEDRDSKGPTLQLGDESAPLCHGRSRSTTAMNPTKPTR